MRDAHAAERFFVKALHSSAASTPQACSVEEQVEEPTVAADPNPTPSVPRVINVDKHAAFPKAFAELKAAGILAEGVELRQVKYLNNLVEQDHRFMCAVSALVRSLSKEGEVESKASRTTAYLATKVKGNKSMHVKRAGLKGCKATRLASPVRMVKLGLLNPSSAW